MIVSYYGDDPARFRRPDVPRIDGKGGKFEGLYGLFAARPDLLTTYDYVWLPDDDLATDCETINRLFSIMAEYRLGVGQPGLAPASYFSYAELVRNPEFLLRYTNFVEAMMPCFEAKFLARVIHLFATLRFGWCLDQFWARMFAEPRYRGAIIDACEVLHTRPIGTGGLYKLGDPHEESRRVRAVLGPIGRFDRHMIYGGVTKEGKRLERGPSFAWRSFKGIVAVAPRVRKSWGSRHFRRRVLKQHVVYRVDMARALSG
jgi:hypothetical protein